jgi:hypothetical protein
MRLENGQTFQAKLEDGRIGAREQETRLDPKLLPWRPDP